MSEFDAQTVPNSLTSDLLVDDPDMQDLVEEFIATIPQKLSDFRQAFEQLDWDRLVTMAHQLKGAGGSYGYQDISQLGLAMEQGFRAHSAEDFAVWMKHLEQLYTAAKNGL